MAHLTDRADRFVANIFRKPAPQGEQVPKPKSQRDMLERLRRRRDRVTSVRKSI